MTRFKATAISLAALAGLAVCAAPLQSASAFTLNSSALSSKATPPADKVFWRGGHGGWRGGGWGPGAVIGGLAAGALLGGAYYGGYYGNGYGYGGYGPGYGYGPGPYYGRCWYDQWGRRVCS
jgi:hypothetical protein